MSKQTIVKAEGEYCIERVGNTGDYFLIHKPYASRIPTAIGGAYVDKNRGEKGWVVDINTPYDDGAMTDIAVLAEHLDEQQAVNLLWENRHNAYTK